MIVLDGGDVNGVEEEENERERERDDMELVRKEDCEDKKSARGRNVKRWKEWKDWKVSFQCLKEWG